MKNFDLVACWWRKEIGVDGLDEAELGHGGDLEHVFQFRIIAFIVHIWQHSIELSNEIVEILASHRQFFI
jgi:hypothetical protein